MNPTPRFMGNRKGRGWQVCLGGYNGAQAGKGSAWGKEANVPKTVCHVLYVHPNLVKKKVGFCGGSVSGRTMGFPNLRRTSRAGICPSHEPHKRGRRCGQPRQHGVKRGQGPVWGK